MAYFNEFFHLMFFQLTLDNSNLQGTGENSSTYRKFEKKRSKGENTQIVENRKCLSAIQIYLTI